MVMKHVSDKELGGQCSLWDTQGKLHFSNQFHWENKKKTSTIHLVSQIALCWSSTSIMFLSFHMNPISCPEQPTHHHWVDLNSQIIFAKDLYSYLSSIHILFHQPSFSSSQFLTTTMSGGILSSCIR